MQNVKNLNAPKNRKLIHTYNVSNDNINNLTDFCVKFYENDDGFREFEIIIATNSSMSYNDVMTHAIYTNFVLPWSYKEKELSALLGDNVVQFKRATR
jgi:hypothetical protein